MTKAGSTMPVMDNVQSIISAIAEPRRFEGRISGDWQYRWEKLTAPAHRSTCR